LSGQTSPTPEQTARGFRAEARFFREVGTYSGKYKPWWFIRVERAPAYMDHRGIDGFAYITKHVIFTQRIPLQIRTRKEDMDYEIRPDKPVFVLTHVTMEHQYMMRNLIMRLEKSWQHDFEPHIQDREMKPVQDWEKPNIKNIVSCRERYQ